MDTRAPYRCFLGGKEGYLNAVGLANPGFNVFAHEIMNNQIPLIVSIVGSSQSDFPKLISKFDKLNILGYEINLSCPDMWPRWVWKLVMTLIW